MDDDSCGSSDSNGRSWDDQPDKILFIVVCFVLLIILIRSAFFTFRTEILSCSHYENILKPLCKGGYGYV